MQIPRLHPAWPYSSAHAAEEAPGFVQQNDGRARSLIIVSVASAIIAGSGIGRRVPWIIHQPQADLRTRSIDPQVDLVIAQQVETSIPCDRVQHAKD